MKKLTALFTIVALLVCMFAFAPTASAAVSNPYGDQADSFKPLPENNPNNIRIYFVLESNNGWLDGTNGVDFVRARMQATYPISCDGSIRVTATYIREGTYTSDSDSDSTTTLGPGFFVVTVYPETDLLSYGDASYSVETTQYGDVYEELSVSCPVAVK